MSTPAPGGSRPGGAPSGEHCDEVHPVEWRLSGDRKTINRRRRATKRLSLVGRKRAQLGLGGFVTARPTLTTRDGPLPARLADRRRRRDDVALEIGLHPRLAVPACPHDDEGATQLGLDRRHVLTRAPRTGVRDDFAALDVLCEIGAVAPGLALSVGQQPLLRVIAPQDAIAMAIVVPR